MGESRNLIDLLIEWLIESADLIVFHLTDRGNGGREEKLVQGRVDIDEAEKLADVILHVHKHDDLMHQRRGLRANEVAAEYRVVSGRD